MYYEGVDYFVKTVDFPSMASPGVSVSNGDGTFTVFINSRFCHAKQIEALNHEVKHLEENHFYADGDLADMEEEACCGVALLLACL